MNNKEKNFFKTKLFELLLYNNDNNEEDDKKYFEKLLYANYLISMELMSYKEE